MAMPPQGKKKMPPQWGAYVTVDDVDLTAKKAAKLGGKVLVPPQDIPGVGRFSVLQDPQGAMISVITYTG
jgi:predicted enzyme related to lactoylglutathione lyase